jgi:tRNA uracil 4-sulfurtransferase
VKVTVRYHEIALKGRNRPFFVDRLATNLRKATADLGGKVHVLAGRLLVEMPDDVPWDETHTRIGSVFGIANYSRITQVARDLDALKAAAVAALRGTSTRSFRVTTKRSDKTFPANSVEIDREVGGAIFQQLGVKVDLHHPEVEVYVEVLRDRIFFSFERLPGAGGFPVGTSGRVAVLLSGGIDSPVAAYRLMKRGCTVTLIHFHSFPILDHTTIDKAHSLARILTRYQYRTRLALVPFGPVQQTIVAHCPAPLRVVLYRRFMVRIAEALAVRYGTKALVTGESLGQVASQTLDNMIAIDEAAQTPILRPLVGMDKEEITIEARRIGTFAVSTLPDQDCCQLFTPRSPATAATLAEVKAAEEQLDVPGLVQAAVAGLEEHRFEFPLKAVSAAVDAT